MAKLPYSVIVTLFFAIGIITPVFSQEDITITTYYPSPVGSYNDLTVSHHLEVVGGVDGNNVSMITAQDNLAGGGSWGPRSAVRGYTYDTDVYGELGRASRWVALVYKYGVYGYENTPGGGTNYAGYFSGDVYAEGTLNASTCVDYTQAAGVTQCPVYSYVIGCGSGNCNAMGAFSTSLCPPDGFMICLKHE